MHSVMKYARRHGRVHAAGWPGAGLRRGPAPAISLHSGAQLHERPERARLLQATGTYAPKGFAPQITVPQGAEEVDGIEGVTRVARRPIGHGADFVKVYADYRWGPNGEARPTFSIDEIAAIVAAAKSSGRSVAAHAST